MTIAVPGLLDHCQSPPARQRLVRTLKPFYKRNKKQFMFAYNDDSPIGKAKSYRGHSKGVVVFDDETGFWMIHSVPNFPPLGSYSYPESGMKFGQIFLCLSLSTEFLEDIGDHLRYVQATPFFSNLPRKFSKRFPILVSIVKKQSLPKSAKQFARVGQLSTIQDLWLDLVAPELDTSLDVESWLNGAADDLDSTCTRRTSIYDVSAVNLPDVSFDSSRDHSKWAVADKGGRKSIVCVGDLKPTGASCYPFIQ
ncbi:deoxyribonuclease II [Cooperia oncophora]